MSLDPPYAHRSFAGSYRTVKSSRAPSRNDAAGCATTVPDLKKNPPPPSPASSLSSPPRRERSQSLLQWITTWSANVLRLKSEGMSTSTLSPRAFSAWCLVS